MMIKTILLFTGLFLAGASFSQQRYFVDAAASGANNGSSWDDAFSDLSTALLLADNGEEVWVKSGTYFPTAGMDRSIAFRPQSGVKLYGGFAGNETSVDQRDLDTYVTILSGNIGDPFSDLDNVYNVVYLLNPDIGTDINGFTVTGGRADVPGFPENAIDARVSGGGVYIMGSGGLAYARFQNCRFTYNFALNRGGAILENGNGFGTTIGSVFQNCHFESNQAGVSGSAFARYGGGVVDEPVDIDHCTFEYNTSEGSVFSWENYTGIDGFCMKNTVFKNNFCQFLPLLTIVNNIPDYNTITLDSCIFEQNAASTTINIAGVTYPLFGAVSIRNCTIQNDSLSNLAIRLLFLPWDGDGLITLENIHIKGSRFSSAISVDSERSDCLIKDVFIDSSNYFFKSGIFLHATAKTATIQHVQFSSSDTIGGFIRSRKTTSMTIKNALFAAKKFSQFSTNPNGETIYFKYPMIYADNQLTHLQIESSLFSLPGDSTGLSNLLGNVVMRNTVALFSDTTAVPLFNKAVSVQLSHNYFMQLDTAVLPSSFSLLQNQMGGDPLLTDVAGNNLHPLPCSPLINAGDGSGVLPGETDLDGNPRILNNQIDIGPYETPQGLSTGTPLVTAACPGSYTGSILWGVSSCGPLFYQWTGPGGVTGTELTGLAAGDYILTVTNNSGGNTTLEITVPVLPVPDLSVQTTPVFCGTTTGGTVKLMPSGGTGPYTCLWEDGSMELVRNGLNYGQYKIRVTDQIGCTLVDSVFVPRVGNLEVKIDKESPLCWGDMNGRVEIIPTNGAQPFQYTWWNGGDTAVVFNLPAGIYSGTLTDALGCGINWIIPMNEPAPVVLPFPVIQPATDTFAADGHVLLTPEGGTPPYTIWWSTGESGADLDNISAGHYTVTVTDLHGCSVTASYVVDYVVHTQDIFIETDPVNLQIMPNPVSAALEIVITAIGPYEVSLSNVAGQQLGSWVSAENQFLVEMAPYPPGVYLVQVTFLKSGRHQAVRVMRL